MSDHNRQTNPLLLIIVILLCLSSGFFLRQSSYDPDYFTKESVTSKATQKPTETPTVSDDSNISPEASEGTWTASGSNWLFLVDGQPYTGWLTDTDHKKYYFNKDGIMQTGWIDVDQKRYYMDQDGIMQTGTITVDGETYELQTDGSLKK